jgi:predicted GNAT family N-acyltransferase
MRSVGHIEAVRVELRSWEEARAAAGPLRYAVFLEEKHALPGIELDELDPQCVHALALDAGGATVGTGRLHPDGLIGRMAVLKDWRRRGVGAAIIRALIEEARRRGYPDVSVSVPLQAAEFYREFGFGADGKVVKEAGVLQQRMRKALA